MFSKSIKILMLLSLATLILAACGGGDGNEPAVSEGDMIQTQAAEFANQALTQTAQAVPPATNTPEPPTATPTQPEPTATQPTLPTFTPDTGEADEGEAETTDPTAAPAQPTATSAPQQSNNSGSCFAASFETETVPDGTRYFFGQPFTKTWRVKNTGSCTWKAGQLELVWLDSTKNGQSITELMGAGSVVPLIEEGSVPPNEYLEIAVDFVAPSEKAKYKVFFKLRQEGTIFGVDGGGTLWVEIETYDPEVESR